MRAAYLELVLLPLDWVSGRFWDPSEKLTLTMPDSRGPVKAGCEPVVVGTIHRDLQRRKSPAFSNVPRADNRDGESETGDAKSGQRATLPGRGLI